MKKIQVKISAQKITNYSYFTITLIAIFTVYALFFFFYENIYRTITESEVIIILKQEVASETVNINKFDQIMESLDLKKSRHQIFLNHNPFQIKNPAALE